MPRITSQKQTKANRHNAAKSTGPRSQGGKRLASLNGVTHGLRACDVVLTLGRVAESPAAYQELLDGLLADFRPGTALERDLVEKLAACFWRSRRALRLEQSSLFHADVPGQRETQLRSDLSDNETRLAQDQDSLRFLESFRTSCAAPPDPADASAFAAFQKQVLKAGGLLALQIYGVQHDVLLSRIREELDDHLVALRSDIDDASQEIASLRLQLSDFDAVAKLGTMPDADSLRNLIRYQAANDRELHRTLYQLLGRRKTSLKLTLRALNADAPTDTPPDSPVVRALENVL